MKTSNKIYNSNRIEHIWVPLLLILINVNLVQTVFLFETQVSGHSWLLIVSSAVSLIMLTLALWRKKRPVLWAAMSAYGLQTALLIVSSI